MNHPYFVAKRLAAEAIQQGVVDKSEVDFWFDKYYVDAKHGIR